MAFGPNLLTNPGAETDADGYSADGGTVDRVTTPTRTGGGAFRLTGDSTPGSVLLFRNGRVTGLVPGRAIRLEMYVRSAAVARTAIMLTDFELTAGGYGGTATTDTIATTTGGWTQIAKTLNVPAGCSEGLVYIRFNDVGASEVHYLDDLSVTMDDGVGGGNVSTRPPTVVLNATPGQPVWGDTITVTITGTDFTGLSTSVTRPSGSAATLTGATTAATSIVPDKIGDYLFTTTATGPGGTSTATRLVTVGAQSYVKTAVGAAKPAVRIIKT